MVTNYPSFSRNEQKRDGFLYFFNAVFYFEISRCACSCDKQYGRPACPLPGSLSDMACRTRTNRPFQPPETHSNTQPTR